MYEKHYVIQRRFHSWENWETLQRKYETLEAAQEHLQRKVKGPAYRIAESYVVIRYKAVKI